MKKTLLFAFVAIAFMACKPSPRELAEKCLYENAVHPEYLKILSCNVTLRPERTKLDTFYHIAHVDGIKNARPYEWSNVTAIYSDSIRVEEHTFPEHYYCCATVECMDDCGNVRQGIGEVAVFPDGSAMMYEEYGDKYYYNFVERKWAQCDTLTDVRSHIDLNIYSDGWGLKQMLLNFHPSANF